MTTKNVKKTDYKLISILTFLLLSLFPLIFDNFYFNITVTKYKTFCILSLGILLTAICYTLLSMGNKESFRKKLSGTDICFLLFLLISIISCIFSEWKSESLSGEQGKYIGLLFILISAGMYYGISRFLSISNLIKFVFPVILILISILALSQFCGYDFFGFYENMADGTNVMYIATFGHVDVFSAFISVYLPVCMYMFCYSFNAEKYLYGIGCFFGILSMFASNSDSSYIGGFVGLICLLVITSGNIRSFQHFGLLTGIYGLSILFWKFLYLLFGETIRTASQLTELASSTYSLLFFMLFALAILLYTRYFIQHEKPPIQCLQTLFFIITICVLLFVIGVFLWFTFIDKETALGSWENYLRFNSQWGSERGYVWTWLTQIFSDADIFHKLFGFGPDTTTLLLYKFYETEMTNELGVFYASAHNEYLNYLVTIGLLGLVSYLGMLITSIIKCFKKCKSERFYGAVGLAVITYSAMAIVNISQPITIPFLFLLLSIANSNMQKRTS